jgi:hypothetical protein
MAVCNCLDPYRWDRAATGSMVELVLVLLVRLCGRHCWLGAVQYQRVLGGWVLHVFVAVASSACAVVW